MIKYNIQNIFRFFSMIMTPIDQWLPQSFKKHDQGSYKTCKSLDELCVAGIADITRI